MSKLYAAYGSNLNIMQMGYRCPTAKVVGIGKILDYKLTFRGVATIEKEAKKEVPVAVWEIKENDEKALDIYEGYSTLYRKEIIEVVMKDKVIKGMVYIMNRGIPHLPTRKYLEVIKSGYNDVGLDLSYLKEALEDTKDRM